MKNETQTQGSPQAEGNKSHKPRRGHKKLIAAIIIVAVCLAAGLTAAYLLMRNSAESTLTQSLQNTLELQQLKFHVDLSDPETLSGTSEVLAVDGVYKKGAGLEATAESTVNADGLETTKHSSWVIDKSSNVYANLSLFDVKVVDSKSPLNTPTTIKNLAQASQLNTESNKDVWVKLDAEGLKHGSVYGLQACTLSMFYKTQSDSKTFVDFVKQLAGSNNLDIQKSASSTYTITANSDRRDDIDTLYTKSALYKSLTDCDQSQYGATGQSVDDILKTTAVTIKLDAAKKIISSVEIKVKGGMMLSATLSPASDVTIAVPKVSAPPKPGASETAESFFQKNAQYLYKNLQKIQPGTASGASSINGPDAKQR